MNRLRNLLLVSCLGLSIFSTAAMAWDYSYPYPRHTERHDYEHRRHFKHPYHHFWYRPYVGYGHHGQWDRAHSWRHSRHHHHGHYYRW